MNSKSLIKNSDLFLKVLTELNLSPLEVQIYQLLLQDPDLNITDLSKKTGFYRLKIYQALDNLSKQELISKTEDYNRKIEIEPPTKIITKLKLKENKLSKINSDFEEILPQIQSQYYRSNRIPVTKIYEGKKQFIHIFHQILEETEKGGEILAISEGDDFYNIIDWDYFEENWMYPRIKKGVYVRTLVRSDNQVFINLQKNDKEHLRQMKVLPKDFVAPGSIWISNNKIINWNTVLARAIVIEDRIMADFYRAMFKVLWDLV